MQVHVEEISFVEALKKVQSRRHRDDKNRGADCCWNSLTKVFLNAVIYTHAAAAIIIIVPTLIFNF
jgi:hypothetical protein